MNELLVLYSEMKRDLQGMKKSLAKISESHANGFWERWNRKTETMKIMGISARTLNRLTSSGVLPFSKINGLIYIKTSDIDRLLNENYNGTNKIYDLKN
jgi:hypothetical protein